jgi:hypothetical protein
MYARRIEVSRNRADETAVAVQRSERRRVRRAGSGPFLENFVRADAGGVGCIEPFDECACKPSRRGREHLAPGAVEKFREGKVLRWAPRTLEAGLHLIEQRIRVFELAAADRKARLRRVDHWSVEAPQPAQRGWRSAVNELRAELQRNERIGFRSRQDAPANPIARLDHTDALAVIGERCGGGEAGRARADHEDIE